MKRTGKLVLVPLLLVSAMLTNEVFASDVTFKANIKSSSEQNMSNVYVRIGMPNSQLLIDSVFSDSEGNIQLSLPFTYTGTNIAIHGNNKAIANEIYPNVISGNQSEYLLEYNYPLKPTLKVFDVQGKQHMNNTKLLPGIYVYYLDFPDGVRSEAKRFAVLHSSHVNIVLHQNSDLKQTPAAKNVKKSTAKVYDDADVFVVELIEDGYITVYDTITVTSNIISRSYQMEEADLPSALFSYSGNMESGTAVLFDATGSLGANSESLVYTWDFGDGKRGQSVSIPHIYNTDGNYDVTLTVSGEYGASQSYTQRITITAGTIETSKLGSAMGIVSGSGNTKIENARITLVEGNVEALSDASGQVNLSALPVGKPIHLKVTKEGFVNQVVELTIPDDTTRALFFTTLKERNTAISLANAEFGGYVEGYDGATVKLPVEAFVTEDGTSVTGDVDIFITPVDVVNEIEAFPGSFEAVNNEGEERVLFTYGVAEYHFEQDGEELQLAPGKTATILIPVYNDDVVLGQHVPLWSVNEEDGKWIQEGMGTIVESPGSPGGVALEAEVGHFTWWNCDLALYGIRNFIRCWYWNCETGECVKERTGAWINARPVTMDDLIFELFVASTYVPPPGAVLLFPRNYHMLFNAYSIDSDGNYYSGSAFYTAQEMIDEPVEIELRKHEVADTIQLELNTQTAGTLQVDKSLIYKAKILEKGLYLIEFNSNNKPYNFKYIFKQKERKQIVYNAWEYNTCHVMVEADTGDLYIATYLAPEQGDFGDGSHTVRFFPVECEEVDIPTSVSDSLTSDTTMKAYSFTPGHTMLLNYKIVSGYNSLLYYSDLFYNEKMYDNHNIRDDSLIAYKLIPGDKTCYFKFESVNYDSFSLVLKEKAYTEINYGDLITDELERYNDMNLYHFYSYAGDMIQIMGMLPEDFIRNGFFKLFSPEGMELAENSFDTEQTNDIIYQIPEDGLYSILVFSDYVPMGSKTTNPSANTISGEHKSSSSVSSFGSYQLFLNKFMPDTLKYNSNNKIEVSKGQKYYFKVEVPEGKISHFSVIGNNVQGGTFDIYSPDSTEITDDEVYTSYKDNYYASYLNTLPAGTYGIVVNNNQSTELYINIFEAEKLEKDMRGEAHYQNRMTGSYETDVYYFKGSPGDGIHSVCNKLSEYNSPGSMEIRYYLLSGQGEIHTTERYLYYWDYLNEYILGENSTRLGGVSDDVWVMVVCGKTKGYYELQSYHVEASDIIQVDDDFKDYPNAATSSFLAACRAIKDGGKIEVADGAYSYCATAYITSSGLELTGQSKEAVHIENISKSNVGLLYVSGSNTSISDLTLSGHEEKGSKECIYMAGNNYTIENISIIPMAGQTKTCQGVTCDGSGILRNVNIDHSKGFGLDIFNAGNLLIEDCHIITHGTGVNLIGENVVFKNNNIEVNSNNWALNAYGAGFSIENNQFTANSEETGNSASIKIFQDGYQYESKNSYFRKNTIINNANKYALDLGAQESSMLLVEDNKILCTREGGTGFMTIDPKSTIDIRNNICNGLASNDVITFWPGRIEEDARLTFSNNTLNVAPTVTHNTLNSFVRFENAYQITDTVNVYFVNNIFKGDGFSSLYNTGSDNLTFYSDYNDVYSFAKYFQDKGALIGGSNDLSADPLFIDDLLHVDPASPVINKGAGQDIFDFISGTDLDGNSRPQGSSVDIGAYEQ